MTIPAPIEDFLAQRRLAVVGEVEGQPCFSRVQDIRPPVDAALLMTSPPVTELAPA